MANKVTPTGTLDWYIKWIASTLILIALTIRASGFSIVLDITLSILGTILWLVVSFMWRDRALIVLNTAALFLMVMLAFRYIKFFH